MIVNFSINDFRRQLDNLVDYSVGFLEGAEYGKKIFLENLGKGTYLKKARYLTSK